MLSVTANEQAQIATAEKLKAEQERSKATIAENQARRLGLLSVAQNLALKSAVIEENPELMGLLAVQAFNFNLNNQGRPDDPIIYEALSRAYSSLDSSRHSVFTGSAREIWVLKVKSPELILSADLDGQVKLWSLDGMVKTLCTLPFNSPINFIGADNEGRKVITQHDNNDLILWNLEESDNLTFEKLQGNGSFVRTIAFFNDNKYLATGDRETSLTIWDLEASPVSVIASLVVPEGIRSLASTGSDTLIVAQQDGSILLWKIRENVMATLYKSDTEKPLVLAWNKTKNTLVAGSSTGSILVFDLSNGSNLQPLRYPVHDAGVDVITFSSDCSLMASSSWDKTIKVYNFNEFIEKGATIGGVKEFGNLNYRIRSMVFTPNNKLVAGLADKSIRIWETSSEKLASMICNIVRRDMTPEEWNEMVGEEIPFEKTCGRVAK